MLLEGDAGVEGVCSVSGLIDELDVLDVAILVVDAVEGGLDDGDLPGLDLG